MHNTITNSIIGFDRIPNEVVDNVHISLMHVDSRYTKFVYLAKILCKSSYNAKWCNMSNLIFANNVVENNNLPSSVIKEQH